jgi:hypothetical protein
MFDLKELRSLLKDSAIVLRQFNVACFDDFYHQMVAEYPQNQQLLMLSLFYFCKLSASDQNMRSLQDITAQQVLFSRDFRVCRSRFFVLLCGLVYFQSQKNTQGLSPLWFLLHYRGLSNTGFHLLHQLGLSPSVNSLTKIWDRVSKDFAAEPPAGQIIWADNLRRTLAGRLPQDCRVDWTVVGYVETPCSLLFDVNFPSVNNFFDPQVTSTMSRLIQDYSTIKLMENPVDELSVPLRVRNGIKYKFWEKDILPLACGSNFGTLSLLRYLVEQTFAGYYTVLVVDYDIFWRIHKWMFTKSVIGSLATVKQRFIILQGPWHIYKSLCEAVWSNFVHIVFAHLWIHVFQKPCPQTPPLKEILYFYIAMYHISKRIARDSWNFPSTNVYGTCILLLLYDLIPLVSLNHIVCDCSETNYCI